MSGIEGVVGFDCVNMMFNGIRYVRWGGVGNVYWRTTLPFLGNKFFCMKFRRFKTLNIEI